MIFYHGLPITPETAAIKAIRAGHAFVSFAHSGQYEMAVAMAQSFAIDNGAFSAWKAGEPILDWRPYYEWVAQVVRVPNFDFAVIPDCVDGGEEENDALLKEWPWRDGIGAPVWHLHESLDRLQRLAADYPRICLGSSGDYATPGEASWWQRMDQALEVLCDRDGYPLVKIHGLRMMNAKLTRYIPFSSVDSTNIARNIGIDVRWTGSYQPATKEGRAQLLRERIESVETVKTRQPIPQPEELAVEPETQIALFG